ncbi:hypothetical protein [Pyrobaculum aerophilum]|uniref:Uncharacterized protein n=1 Tax=Pyrobaculum aerophilum TaxID=13773 RepID=A0A371QWV7_9CREN|nr:hypothetical protein [Pyrobaculum aerophilum]RFA94923.1 hypothetical protein CGL51_08915 [Pyrobaculum aerophilum]RFA98023.1 hypothetical protein CGL52_08175 [Pyrobaculum aerophilum]
MALTELEVLLPKLTKMPPAKKIAILYKLRGVLDEESFRQIATLLSIDLSRGENPQRWSLVDAVEEVEEYEELAVDEIETDFEFAEAVEEDEYVGKRFVERLWKSSI